MKIICTSCLEYMESDLLDDDSFDNWGNPTDLAECPHCQENTVELTVYYELDQKKEENKMKKLKETLLEIRLQALEKIKRELEPHFKNYGGLYIEDGSIKINYGDDDITLVWQSYEGRYLNYYTKSYNVLNINITDVFEEISNNDFLDELKIKPFKEFDVNEWKKEFAERHNLRIDIDGYVIDKYDHIIITGDHDVNHKYWNMGLFQQHHIVFKFDNESIIKIDSQELADEFERVYIIMREYVDDIENNVPSLEKNN